MYDRLKSTLSPEGITKSMRFKFDGGITAPPQVPENPCCEEILITLSIL